MNLHQRLRRIFYDWIRQLYAYSGHDIFRSKGGFEPYLFTYVTYGLIFLMIVSTTYTVIISEWSVKLSVLPYLGLCIDVNIIFYFPLEVIFSNQNVINSIFLLN